MSEIKRFTFRVPSDLYDEIEKIAKINRRSTTAEIIVAIEEYLQYFPADKFTEKSDND